MEEDLLEKLIDFVQNDLYEDEDDEDEDPGRGRGGRPIIPGAPRAAAQVLRGGLFAPDPQPDGISEGLLLARP